MNKIIKAIIGDFSEKTRYRDNEKRAKAVPVNTPRPTTTSNITSGIRQEF